MKDFHEVRATLREFKELSPRLAITIQGLKGNIKKLQDSLLKKGDGIQFNFGEGIESEEIDREEYKGNTIIFAYMDDFFDSSDIKGDIFKDTVKAAKALTKDSKNGNDPIYKEAEKLNMTSGKPFVYSVKLVK